MFPYVYDDSEIESGLLQIIEKIKPLLKSITAGATIRDINDPKYYQRRLYTQELRKIVYNPALFNQILVNEKLKEIFFRGFGYQENLDFTMYPNVWLRDLALVGFTIGKGVYLGDGMVLGTNQVSPDQKKLHVGPIKIGANTIFDQGCKIGLRTSIGEECVIGINCNIGLYCNIGHHVIMGPITNISHFCKIGNGVKIGAHVTVGDGVTIESGAVIEDFAFVPRMSHVK